MTQNTVSVGSYLASVLEEAVGKHLHTHHNHTARACFINSEVDNKDRAVTPAGPLDVGGAD
jgi:hypothetical protein